MSPANWWKLRSVGNLKVLKISYLVLLAIPILTTHNTITMWLGFKPWLLASAFFVSLFLALANLLYDISCPVIVKRFESPNDLYSIMLNIKEKSLLLYPQDNFEASFDHCNKAYEQATESKPFIRFLCQTFFVLSGILTMVIFLNRSIIVIKAIVQS